jgi:hypothetical protein
VGLAMASGLCTAACLEARQSEAGAGSESVSPITRKGLYVVEGSNMDGKSNDCLKGAADWKSNTSEMHHTWKNPLKWCAGGTNVLAIDAWSVYDELKRELCDDAIRHGMNLAYFAGNSRGAIVALTLATDLARNPRLCHQGAPVRIAWVGLIDAVDANMLPRAWIFGSRWSKEIPRPGGHVLPNIHVINQPVKMQGFFATRRIERATVVKAPESEPGKRDNDDHGELGWNRAVLRLLVESARSAGALL